MVLNLEFIGSEELWTLKVWRSGRDNDRQVARVKIPVRDIMYRTYPYLYLFGVRGKEGRAKNSLAGCHQVYEL